MNNKYTAAKNNTSGIIGISLYARPYESLRRGSDAHYYWQVTYRVNTKHHTRKFSVMKYGYEEAFLMACAFRYQIDGELVIVDRKSIPCLPKVPYVFRTKRSS